MDCSCGNTGQQNALLDGQICVNNANLITSTSY